MGTTYTIKVVSGRFAQTDHLHELIKNRLNEINASMSSYSPESEISVFNTTVFDKNRPFTPSDDFLEVMRLAKNLHQLTDGAWDGSLDPLITAWGFGRDGLSHHPPSEETIKERMELVGFDKVTITADGKLFKKDPRVSIDLASIAKGYGVDSVADVLKKQGFEHFLVEIGGEVFGAGHRLDGTPWRVGINVPKAAAGLKEVYKIVLLGNQGFATSGDYRNFFQYQGKRYSHIIDSRTGYPVANGVVSVSVMADSCAMADGLATALMVMGPEAGVALINGLAGAETLMLVETGGGEIREYASRGFNDSLM